MIEIAPTTAIMVYLAITCAVILGLWGVRHIETRKKKLKIATHALRICEYCRCAYLDDSEKAVTKCPHCESFNKDNTYEGVAK